MSKDKAKLKGRVFRRKRRDGSFYPKWSYVVDADGNGAGRRQITVSNKFESEAEARLALAKALSEMQDGTFVEPTTLTVGAYLRQWLPTIKGQVRPSTFRSYESYVNNHLIKNLGGIKLQALLPSHLKKLYADLEADGSKIGKKGGMSSRSIRYCHSLMSMALRDALVDGLVKRNVALLVKPPKLVQGEMKFWKPYERRGS